MTTVESTKRKSSTVRVLLALVVIGAAGAFVFMQLQKRRLIETENRAVALQNQEQYDQAVAAYEALLPRLKDDAAQRVRHNVAVCYAKMADEPGIAFEDAIVLYRKAYAYDPESVTNPAILRRLEAAE